jgi:signal transduction histidine kinase/CheY-like chemotaxis protein
MIVTEAQGDGERDPTAIRRALAAGFALVAAIGLVVLIGMVSVSNQQRDAALKAQRHSFEVMNLSRTLEASIARSEATLGRYVITGNPRIGISYFDEWRRAGYLLGRLRRIVNDDQRQVRNVERLRGLYRERGEQLAEVAVRTNYKQNWNALGRYAQAGTADNVKLIAKSLDAIINTERVTLERRSGTAARSVERSTWLATILSVFGVVVVLGAIGLAYATMQEMAQRRLARKDAEEVARRAIELEEAVATRTAELRSANAALLAEAAEREAAESRLRQIQKMEAVGQLTGGIAHDFNNMLAVVLGGLELARRRITENARDATRHIDNAMEGASRAAALTRRLLAFARAEPLLPEPLSPDALIEGMTELLDRVLGERIAVRTDFRSHGWRIWIDRHALENALLNLAVNARDAMDGEGVLTIATTTRRLADDEVGGSVEGDYVAIAVTDTGCGMLPDVVERAFEPFFTTKPVGKGTGLGLSQIFGFVRQSNGEIAIESEPGAGTTVTILLPRYTGAAITPRREGQPSLPAPVTAPAAILVVEDDPRVLNATVSALNELGHRTIACSNPDQAAALMAANPDVRLIISDVVMPGISGPELIAQLHPVYPHVGILFVTGYAGEVEEADAFGGHDVLRKPFTIGALEAAVAAALGRPSEPPPVATAAAAE